MKKVVIILFIFNMMISACSSSSMATPSLGAPTSTETTIPPTTIPLTPTKTPLPPTPTLVPESGFIKGITLNDQGLDLDTKYSYQVIDEYVIPFGANYVALIPTCWSENMNDTNIVCANEDIPGVVMGVSDEELINTIIYLHSAGLRVLLKPQALIKTIHATNEETKTRHYTQAQWDAWFASYTAFILHYAQIAEDYQVDMFAVGNEQEETTLEEQGWRDVISAVRDVYHGPITYAANSWEFEASNIKFWDALDYIGTNSYSFGQVNKDSPTVEDMQQHWTSYLEALEAMSNQYGKQVLITEMGARSVTGFNEGNLFDWQSNTYDGQAQADFYIAAFEALKDKPWVKGIIIWDINTSLLQGGANDGGYTFIAKPAEQAVRRYFEGEPIIPVDINSSFEEDAANSMWIYRDGLVNTWIPWDDPEAVELPDLTFSGGHNSAFAIRISPSKSKGLFLNYGASYIDLSKYKWLEFYVMVDKRPPQGLIAIFEDWVNGKNLGSRIALVKDPKYLEGGEYLPGTWQRVRIPIVDLGYTNQKSAGFAMDILNCAWPCTTDPTAGDYYIDDIRLVAGK